MSKSLVVVTDLDGVLLDFEGAWGSCSAKTLGRPTPRVTDDFHMMPRYNLSEEEYHNTWSAFHRDGWWGKIERYPYADDLVSQITALGVDLWAVTNADPEVLSDRVKSLNGLIPVTRILTLGFQASAKVRAEMLEDLNAIAFLDDQIGNCNAACYSVAASVHLYRGYGGCENPSSLVSVIDDPFDFVEILRGMLAWEHGLNRFGGDK